MRWRAGSDARPPARDSSSSEAPAARSFCTIRSVIGSLETFLLPLYQDLDGVSRAEEVERIGQIARALAPPSRDLELLIHFHLLGRWLEKVGNLSRTILAVRDVSEN